MHFLLACYKLFASQVLLKVSKDVEIVKSHPADWVQLCGWEVMDRLPYNPDLTPC